MGHCLVIIAAVECKGPLFSGHDSSGRSVRMLTLASFHFRNDLMKNTTLFEFFFWKNHCVFFQERYVLHHYYPSLVYGVTDGHNLLHTCGVDTRVFFDAINCIGI